MSDPRRDDGPTLLGCLGVVLLAAWVFGYLQCTPATRPTPAPATARD